MDEASMHNRGLEKTIRAHEMMGKKVLSINGKEIGKVKEICLDQENLDFRGVIIDRGWIERDLFVGKSYIQGLGKDSVLLKMVPFTEFKGMKVIDSTGAEVGRVKEVHRVNKTNKPLSLIVSRGGGKKELVVMESDLENVGETIVLNQKVSEVEG